MDTTDSSPSPRRSRLRRLLKRLLLLTFCFLVGEGGAWYLLSGRFHLWDVARRGLAGQGEATFQSMVGQSYLNYVPSPGFRNQHGPQHSAHGYRGELVPQHKAPGTLRILCLGGSTTYGWGVERAEETYPAQLRGILSAAPPAGYERVEVINAGLPWGTSAELLNHYHFKFHYFQPDIVVVHTGLNDAQAFDMETYQPDYDHWRKQMNYPLVLPRGTRWLARSHLVGMALVPALLGSRPEAPSFNRKSRRPAVEWYDGGRFDFDAPERVPDREVAFLHNLRSLVHEIQRDGAIVLTMPVEFRSLGLSESELEKRVHRTRNSLRYTRHNAELLSRLAEERNAVFVPFPQDRLEPSQWVEIVHLGPEGCRTKAEHVADYVRRALDDGR